MTTPASSVIPMVKQPIIVKPLGEARKVPAIVDRDGKTILTQTQYFPGIILIQKAEKRQIPRDA